MALCDTQLAYIFSYLKLALLSNCSLDIGGGSSSSSSDWLPDCFSAGGSVTDIEGAIPTGGERQEYKRVNGARDEPFSLAFGLDSLDIY